MIFLLFSLISNNLTNYERRHLPTVMFRGTPCTVEMNRSTNEINDNMKLETLKKCDLINTPVSSN